MTGEEMRLTVSHTDDSGQGAEAVGWSIERLLYGLAFAIGVWLRLWSLGAQPLSPWEASNSWPAWLAAHGLVVADSSAPTSALYYGLQWLLFWTGVDSDGGARFSSAVIGAMLILLPWWWRAVLGRRVALLAAFLIVMDPWLVGFSRLADGAILAIGVAMVALVAVSQVVIHPQAMAWKRALAISFGLLLVAGPMGWNLLPVVVWWGWLLRRELSDAGMLQRQWLLWIVVAAIGGATFLLMRLDGLAWLASGMSVWLAQVDGRSAGPLLAVIAGGYDLWWPWLRVWIDASLLLLLGSAGLGVLVLRFQRNETSNSLHGAFLPLCSGWLIWGGVLWLLPGRNPLSLPVVGIPLLLLTAIAIDALVRHVPRNLDWREAGAVVLTLLILVISGMIWLTSLLSGRGFDPIYAQAAMVIFGLAIAILVAFGIWANRRDAAWLAATLLSVLLVMFYLRGSWKLNFGNVLTEPAGWQASIAHPELRTLAMDMQTLSSHRSGDPYQLPVQVQVAPYMTQGDTIVPARPDPTIGWELRNMRNLTWVASPRVADDANPLPLVVTPVSGMDNEAQLDLLPVYAGSRYHVDSLWLPETLMNETSLEQGESDLPLLQRSVRVIQPWWRWVIYREPSGEPRHRAVILWAPIERRINQ